MLLIKNPEDLIKYLIVRQLMIENQKKDLKTPSWESGAIHGFEESIKAIQAMITTQANEAKNGEVVQRVQEGTDEGDRYQ